MLWNEIAGQGVHPRNSAPDSARRIATATPPTAWENWHKTRAELRFSARIETFGGFDTHAFFSIGTLLELFVFIPAALEFFQGGVDMLKNLVVSTLAALVLMTGWPGIAQAQQQQGCFVGRDHTGGSAALWLSTERYGDYYGILGALRSVTVGTMRIKADGWSGAGRMFRGHEYESGALYIQISDYTGSSLVLWVEGYGRFPFRKTRC